MFFYFEISLQNNMWQPDCGWLILGRNREFPMIFREKSFYKTFFYCIFVAEYSKYV